MKYIVIGVAGGATAAAYQKKHGTGGNHFVREGEYISYANCGLPYYIGGVIAERENCLYRLRRLGNVLT